MPGILYWHFDPILLSIGPLSIRWYGLLFAIAFLFGYWFMTRVCKAENQTRLDLDNLLYYLMGGIILGARLAHCLIYDPAYYLSHPLDILKIWEGGLASHGGAVGGLLGLWLYSRHHALPSLLWLIDRITLPAMFGGALVRCANFLNSEIVGNPTDGTWGVVFESVDALPRHPVQLYEATAYLVIFLILLTVYRRYREATPHGLLTGIFFASVFFTRFVLEYFKTPQAAYESGFSVSVGQWLSVPFLLGGVALAAYALRSSRR
jgi:prolipoprotein diacylglyceryl transferase